MGINKRYFNYGETLIVLQSDKLEEYYGKTELFIFEDTLSEYIYKLYNEGKTSYQILKILENEKNLNKN